MKINIFLEIKYYIVVILKLCILMTTNAQQLLYESQTDYNTSKCSCIVFEKHPKTHTIILDTLQNNWSLHNCLNSLTDNDNRIILTGDYILDAATKTKLEYFLHHRPNIIIFTKSLSSRNFYNTVADVLLQSRWSLINIVVVNNETFVCESGYFGREINATIYRFLNRIWKRYQVVRVVVEYPTTCPNRFSTYDGNKKPSQKVGQHYERTVTTVDGSDVHEILKKSDKNLAEGYPLKANIFYRFPTSITECNNLKFFMVYNSNLTNGYCGVDALVMQDILQVIKFNTTFKETKTPSSYGYVQGGHATGTLGLIVRGEIDISFNSRFMVLYLKDGFDFLYSIWSDSLCALMMEPSAVPLWRYPFNVYQYSMWFITITSLAFLGLVMYARSIFFKYGGHSLHLYIYIVNAIWAGLLGFFFNKRIQRSLLAATCLLSSVVFTARYQGHVNYMFATLVRYDRLSTLQEMCENNVQVYTAPSIAVLLNSDSDEEINKPKTELIEHLKYYPGNTSATEFTVSHPNIATVERSDVLLQTLFKFRDENGRPLLYTVAECFQKYHLSYIVRTGFLFTHDLRVLIMKIVEAGLPSVYYKWTRYTFTVVDRDPKPISEPRPYIDISMQEQIIPFLLLLVGYAVSTAVFCVELWWSSRTKRARDLAVMQTYLD